MIDASIMAIARFNKTSAPEAAGWARGEEMESVLTVVPHGENVPGIEVTPQHVHRLLERLSDLLEEQSLRWEDVSLLLLANSKVANSFKIQQDNDQNIKDALDEFSRTKNWYPSLIGATVFGSFYSGKRIKNFGVDDGLTFVAFCSAVFDRVPVAHVVNKEDVAERRFAGGRALSLGLRAFADKMLATTGMSIDLPAVTSSSFGLILTSGSGHIEGQTANASAESEHVVDFKECYAVGQELLDVANEVDAQLFGGCATNRTTPQSQALYYSEDVGTHLTYKYTYNHGAVLAFIPNVRATPRLDHPYKQKPDFGKLEIEFHPRDQYSDGRYFYVRRINGRSPIDFLADHWEFTTEELEHMVATGTAIPSEPSAHLVTVASSLNRTDTNTWPNVPIWLERIDGEVMLRLVRAEAEDSNYYLMEMKPDYIRDNAASLLDSMKATANDSSSVLAFLCESRKYVLDSINSNAEAAELLGGAPINGALVGIYLNGEYSTGAPKSIGYHNYSLIAAIIADKPLDMLPGFVLKSRELAALQVFASHATEDKFMVRAFCKHIESVLPGTSVWIDEKKVRVGESLDDVVKTAIERDHQAFVVFLTVNSVESEWVQRELTWALEQEKVRHRFLIFPVVFDEEGDRILNAIRATWDANLATAIEPRLHLRVTDYTDEECRTKARRLANDIRERVAEAASTLPRGTSFSTLPRRPQS